MRSFIACVHITGFHGIWIKKFLCDKFLQNHFFAACDMIQKCTKDWKLNNTFVHFSSLTRNEAEIQKTAWINCHNLIKQIWIICTCHQWDRSSLTGGNDTGAMADFRFNKIGDHLHIQKIGVCHIRFLGTSKSQQVDSVNGVFITEKRNELFPLMTG